MSAVTPSTAIPVGVPDRAAPSKLARFAMAVGRRIVRFISTVWLLAALLLLWQWAASRSTSLFFPPVSTIFSTVREEFFSGSVGTLFTTETFRENVFASLSRAGRGWLFALIIGTTVGVIVGMSRNVAFALTPLIRFLMSIPATVLLPLAVVLFGVTSSMNVFLIAFGSMWVILVNTMDGVRHIDETSLLTARSLHLSRWRTFFKVLLPGASPQIFSGIRISIGIGLILMVVSELFAAASGIGYYIVYAQRMFNYNQVWAGVFLLAIIGILVNLIAVTIERRVLRWHIQSRSHNE
ncbi:ABC transporter permease [Desertimonas flava]|uniref:ABC transporter permease n=1 Tax=Desertimonas flava TaxID=2064846 RepID=UPI0013C42B6C|nr:ABC transporter permease [Desertimonas flava]